MNGLFYHFKLYIIFVLGFISGSLEHTAKWISVISLITASLIIEYWRYKYRKYDYEKNVFKK